MLVKYYKNKDLAYANRKRFLNFNFSPFSQEEHKSVLLGDGAKTQIKTNKKNICDYVTIEDTRWFVTSYVYLNGGQVLLNLQRDVVGEMGIGDCYGKIERGYTETVLRNRKELSLNEVLVARKKLEPIKNSYGVFDVDNHKNEMWGILYITKPKDGEEKLNINIPAFNPTVVEYDFIEKGSEIFKSYGATPSMHFNVGFSNPEYVYRIKIDFFIENNQWNYVGYCDRVYGEKYNFYIGFDYKTDGIDKNTVLKETDYRNIASNIIYFVGRRICDNLSPGFELPVLNDIPQDIKDYDGVVVKKDDVFYSYKTNTTVEKKFGSVPSTINTFYNMISLLCDDNYADFNYSGGYSVRIKYTVYLGQGDASTVSYESFVEKNIVKFDYNIISSEEAGDVVIDVTQQLVDEPFIIVVCPLYDVKIIGSRSFNVSRQNAFSVFNSVIQSLSGDNGYIVDAQIYPYCPFLTSHSFTLRGVPFFSINSTSFSTDCAVDLRPDVDVKKEYIKRKYSIISPEKSGKFDFNFYDYKTKIIDDNGVNSERLYVKIKTALKPFSIVSSAVITPDNDSIIGMTYDSDLRGCQPSGNGFQCSIASNAFETYKRQNSNYQQIFGLQQDELALSHKTEKVNENTNAIISSITAGLMGTMAGAAAADGFWGDFVHSQAIGATAGGVTATAAVAATQAIQIAQNNELRDFEKYMQKQMFDLQIGTIKNLPNSVNRISSFNEIILKDFYYIVEIYECTSQEKKIVDDFVAKYSYGIGVFDFISNYVKNGWFVRSTLTSSCYPPNLHNVASNELMGGIYIYE